MVAQKVHHYQSTKDDDQNFQDLDEDDENVEMLDQDQEKVKVVEMVDFDEKVVEVNLINIDMVDSSAQAEKILKNDYIVVEENDTVEINKEKKKEVNIQEQKKDLDVEIQVAVQIRKKDTTLFDIVEKLKAIKEVSNITRIVETCKKVAGTGNPQAKVAPKLHVVNDEDLVIVYVCRIGNV